MDSVQFMPKVQCIYCDKVYDPARTRGVCTECGREHPPGTLAQTPGAFHVAVAAERMPRRRLTSEELQAQQQASNALFSVAFLYLLGYGVLLAMIVLAVQQQGQPMPPRAVRLLVLVGASLMAVPFVFALLGWWARYEPLAPTVLGLVLYTGVALFTCVLVRTPCIDAVVEILIFIALIRALQAALAARQARQAPAES
jgi:hypothetical protein